MKAKLYLPILAFFLSFASLAADADTGHAGKHNNKGLYERTKQTAKEEWPKIKNKTEQLYDKTKAKSRQQWKNIKNESKIFYQKGKKKTKKIFKKAKHKIAD